MFVRGLLLTGALLMLAPAARADSDTASIILMQQQLQANFLASAQQLQYGYTPNGYGDTFSTRHTWQDLRLRPAGTARTTGTRLLLTRASSPTRAPIRYRTTPGVGGLGRQISSGAPSVTLHGITAGGEGGGGSPAFGNLHEGNSSFSFGGTRPGSE